MQYAVHEYFMNKRFVSVRRVEEEGEGMKGLVEGGRGGYSGGFMLYQE